MRRAVSALGALAAFVLVLVGLTWPTPTGAQVSGGTVFTNAGFEEGLTGWTTSGTVTAVMSPRRSGLGAARLGPNGGTLQSGTVDIPSDATSVLFSFWYQPEVNSGDTIWGGLVDAATGQTLAGGSIFSNTLSCQVGSWCQYSNGSLLTGTHAEQTRGRTVYFQIQLGNSWDAMGRVAIDDVSIVHNGTGAATATPTLTPTNTPTSGGSDSSPAGYHIFGDVAVNGATKSGATARVRNSDGSIDYTATYGAAEGTTSLGRYRLTDSATDSSKLHYYFDVPSGSYTITVASGSYSASTMVSTSGTTTADTGYGTYYVQPISELTLSQGIASSESFRLFVPVGFKGYLDPTAIPTPSALTLTASIAAVGFDAAGGGFAVGARGTAEGVIYRHLGNGTWQEVILQPTPNAIYDVAVLPSGKTWMVGWYCQIIHFDGTTWRVQHDGTATTPEMDCRTGGLRAVDAVSETSVWALGQYDGSGFRTYRYDGTTWRQAATIPAGLTHSVTDIDFVSDDEGWAVGYSGGDGKVWRYSGGAWTLQAEFRDGNASPTGSGSILGLKMRSATEGYAVTERGRLVRYDGSTWQLDGVAASVGLDGLALSPSGSVYVLSESLGVPPDAVYRYTGSSYEMLPRPSGDPRLAGNAMAFAPDGSLWIGGTNVLVRYPAR